MPDRLLDIYNTLEEIQADGGGGVTNISLDTSLANQTTTLSGDLDEVTSAVLAGNAADAVTSVRGKTVYLEFTPTAMTNTWGGFTSLASWDTALGLTAAVQRVQKGSSWFLLTFFGEFHLVDGLFPASSGLVKFIDLDGVFTSLGSGVLGVSDDTKMIVIPKAREWVGNLFPSTRTITDSFYLDISNLLSVFSRPKEDLLHPLEGKNFVFMVGHSF